MLHGLLQNHRKRVIPLKSFSTSPGLQAFVPMLKFRSDFKVTSDETSGLLTTAIDDSQIYPLEIISLFFSPCPHFLNNNFISLSWHLPQCIHIIHHLMGPFRAEIFSPSHSDVKAIYASWIRINIISQYVSIIPSSLKNYQS